MVIRKGELSGVSFIIALILFMRAPPSWSNYTPKASSPNVITSGVRFQHTNFGGKGTKTYNLIAEGELVIESYRIGQLSFSISDVQPHFWPLRRWNHWSTLLIIMWRQWRERKKIINYGRKSGHQDLRSGGGWNQCQVRKPKKWKTLHPIDNPNTPFGIFSPSLRPGFSSKMKQAIPRSLLATLLLGKPLRVHGTTGTYYIWSKMTEHQ